VGDVEQWIAEQRWEAVPGGWRVRGQFHGRWRFRLEQQGFSDAPKLLGRGSEIVRLLKKRQGAHPGDV